MTDVTYVYQCFSWLLTLHSAMLYSWWQHLKFHGKNSREWQLMLPAWSAITSATYPFHNFSSLCPTNVIVSFAVRAVCSLRPTVFSTCLALLWHFFERIFAVCFPMFGIEPRVHACWASTLCPSFLFLSSFVLFFQCFCLTFVWFYNFGTKISLSCAGHH